MLWRKNFMPGLQVDAVTRLLMAVSNDTESESAVNYLLQHSTGSGKSATIACLVSQLAGWRDCTGGEFHTVLVVNDRLQLDLQLSTCVVAFWEGRRVPRVHVAGTHTPPSCVVQGSLHRRALGISTPCPPTAP